MDIDYKAWKTWWYAALYGASAENRMKAVDEVRRNG